MCAYVIRYDLIGVSFLLHAIQSNTPSKTIHPKSINYRRWKHLYYIHNFVYLCICVDINYLLFSSSRAPDYCLNSIKPFVDLLHLSTDLMKTQIRQPYQSAITNNSNSVNNIRN